MFERLLSWIREVINKMIGQTSVKQALSVDIAVSAPMMEALRLWSLLYANQPPWQKTDTESLNLPAAIAHEIARAVTIELKIEVAGSARATYLNEQFKPVIDKLGENVEVGVAKGGLMFKPFVQDNQVVVDYIQADQFCPVAFDSSGNITACVFADQRTIGNKYYTRLEYHQMIGTGCRIVNMAFRSDAKDVLGSEIPLASVDAWANLQPTATIAGIDKPLYAYFRNPLANNIDSTSPLGVSCYSRAVDMFEQVDQQWTDFLWEFESGNRALYVELDAFKTDVTGKKSTELPTRRLYRTLNASGPVGSESFFEAWSPEYREVSILNGLDAIMRRIEFSCGLAYGTLSNPQSVDKTATELKISQQRSYATITDTQKALQDALEQLLYAMDVWTTLGNLAPAGKFTATYDFDDGVIVDKESQMRADTETVGMSAMPKYVFLMRNYGLDEATAKKWIADYVDEEASNQNVPSQWYAEQTNPAQAQVPGQPPAPNGQPA